ncbi:MAG: hypothetical protein Q4B70_19145, partial [Lachnospiraceae bacterium]|nr:hypothetical protein [Lachnospiraceae bacterium]
GHYQCQYASDPLKYMDLYISVASDPSLDNMEIGAPVASFEFYDTEYFSDGINKETNYESGTIYKGENNTHILSFASGGSCSLTVDENGVNLSGSGFADGYYTLIERYHP